MGNIMGRSDLGGLRGSLGCHDRYLVVGPYAQLLQKDRLLHAALQANHGGKLPELARTL